VKTEIGSSLPKHFVEYWPGQYEVFSHFEYACGIPHVLFAVTTLKENGKPNINFHAWSCFQGDEGGFFVVMAGIYQHTHTYANIMREGEFCVNFLSVQYYDALVKTIQHNGMETDEFEAGGFTPEPSRTISAPRISESFLTLECTRHSIADISGAGRTALIIGKVQQIAAETDYAKGIDKKYSPDGFMFNIHSPKNLTTGGDDVSAVATLHLEKTY
jgi:flavin reductase (DIM6/NTAB) family NADH-FMN oxidoreductase RutF